MWLLLHLEFWEYFLVTLRRILPLNVEIERLAGFRLELVEVDPGLLFLGNNGVHRLDRLLPNQYVFIQGLLRVGIIEIELQLLV